MNKTIGLIGFGKMGGGIALNLIDNGYKVVGWNRTALVLDEFEKQGVIRAETISDLVNKLPSPKVIWLMLPAGETTQEMLLQLKDHLSVGDFIIEGGNSYFKNDIENAKLFENLGINYVDVGVSGGPSGARNGACLMIGGKKVNYEFLEELFKALSLNHTAYQFFEGFGAGHYVKMVHNGIEYGMMQAIAEGFNLMKKSTYNLSMKDIAKIYNNGSVIESRLTKWLENGFEVYGEELDEISGSVDQNGEGEWTVNTAKEINEDVKVIEDSVQFRKDSFSKPSYTGKVLAMLRNMFGGHKAR